MVTLTISISTTLPAQSPSKVNESCSVMPCESGLYCVEVKGGSRKCAACDQSTLGSLTDKVEECCKTFGGGWTPESSAEYQAALAMTAKKSTVLSSNVTATTVNIVSMQAKISSPMGSPTAATNSPKNIILPIPRHRNCLRKQRRY